MKFSKLKKTVALLVCLTCMLSAMPLNVFATEEEQTTSGGASVNTQHGVGTQLSDQEKRNATLKGIRDGLGGNSKNCPLEEIEQMAISQGWIDSNGNLTDGAPRDIKESVSNTIEAAKNEKLYTTGDAKGAANFVAQDYEKKTGEKLSDETLANLELVYLNSVYTDVDEQDAQWANANGQKIAFQVAVNPIVANMMTRAGYDDPVKFSQDLAAGKIDPAVAQDWEEWKKVNDIAANSDNGAGTHAKDDFMRDYFDKYPPASKNEWFTKYFNYILIQGQMIESLGGGYTLSVDNEGNLVFTSTDPGAAVRIFTISKYDMQINYTGFRAEYYRLYGVNLSDEEIFKMITDYLQERDIIEKRISLVVDHDSYKEVLAYMNEAYTYIKEVTFTLTRADNKEIRHNEIPTITPQSFKENFIRFKDGNYYGTNVEMKLKASGMSKAEQDLFKDLFEQPVFANDTHRRRATAYLYAYFCLEEWLCEVTGHPLEPSDTYLQFSQGTKIGVGQDAGWKVNGSRMTLTIDFYKSFVELSKVTGINVNDIIRNYISDYTEPQWQEENSGYLQISYTTHGGKLKGYFGNTISASEVLKKANVEGSQNIGGWYYNCNIPKISRTIENPNPMNNKQYGIGRANTGNTILTQAAWVTNPNGGNYLGTVHSKTNFETYFNNQSINTSMFKLGDKTGVYGYVPFLVTNRPEISSAFNVQVDAIEYTLFMPCVFSETIKDPENDSIRHPSWIYFPHREVPSITTAATEAFGASGGTCDLWDFKDATEENHDDLEYTELYKKYFTDPSYYLFFEEGAKAAGVTPTTAALSSAREKLREYNLREDMLQYYAGFAYRKVHKGNSWDCKYIGPFPGYDSKSMAEFLADVAKQDNFTDDCPEALLLQKYNFSYATTTDPETNKTYCYAIFGPALTFNEGGLVPHDHSQCHMKDTDGDGVNDTIKHEHYSNEYGCGHDCAYCEYYFDETNQHRCSKGTGRDHLDNCCVYVTPSVSGGAMPTILFNDTHGNLVINSNRQKSNNFAQPILGITDMGLNAINGGVKTDHHRWAWATTLEGIPDPDPDPDPEPTPPPPDPDPNPPTGGGNGGGGGNPPNPGETKPYPWPTPITPPGGLKLFEHIGKVIETFITV